MQKLNNFKGMEFSQTNFNKSKTT